MFQYNPLEGSYEVPRRVIGANIPYEWLVYVFALIPLVILVIGSRRKMKVWKDAQMTLFREDHFWPRMKAIASKIFLQKKVMHLSWSGRIHFILFWSFLILFSVSLLDAAYHWFNWPILEGSVYLFSSAIADIAGLLAFLCVIGFAVIRYIIKPQRLSDLKCTDGFILLLIGAILLSGFVLEGARIAGQVQLSTAVDQIAYEKVASPVGWLFHTMFLILPNSSVLLFHRILWWGHMTAAFVFLSLIPFTKLWHLVGAAVNYSASDPNPSALRHIENLEEAEHFGAEKLADFSWKDLADLDVCIRCGRCQEVCPAYAVGKILNPKLTLIMAMKKHMDKYRSDLRIKDREKKKGNLDEASDNTALIDDIVTPGVIWSCTNCKACVDICPMEIEHIAKIVEMRRNLILWREDIPSGAKSTFVHVERNQNPWGIGFALRDKWLDEQNIREIIPSVDDRDETCEYLLYGGCAAAFDNRYKKVGEAAIRLLSAAGVSLRYFGNKEPCCGDSVRRLGNEYLYQNMVAANVELFDQYQVKKVITLCPHCFNALKNEYPQMGGHYEVFHISEVLYQLLTEKKLTIQRTLPYQVSYQDPCFLGRYNGVYQEPRKIIKEIGAKIMETQRSCENSFCCGAGGGMMWLDDHSDDGTRRINEERVKQLLEASPDVLTVSCPFCMTMLSDGLIARNRDDLKVYDVIELLWKCVDQNANTGKN